MYFNNQAIYANPFVLILLGWVLLNATTLVYLTVIPIEPQQP